MVKLESWKRCFEITLTFKIKKKWFKNLSFLGKENRVPFLGKENNKKRWSIFLDCTATCLMKNQNQLPVIERATLDITKKSLGTSYTQHLNGTVARQGTSV